jgi:uncharacterized protein
MEEIPQLIKKEDIYQVIPKETIREVLGEYQFDFELSNHGFGHWTRVLENGLIIADMNNANKKVIIVFSFFHDLARISEEKDSEHGLYGAELLIKYKKELNLNKEEFLECYEACKYHSSIFHHDNKNIATCWDADRLDLMRNGIYPLPEKLNTYVAKQSGIIVLCNKKAIQQVVPEWASDLFVDIFI